MSSLPGAVIAHLYIRKKRKNVMESFFPSRGKNREGKAQVFIDCWLLTIDDADESASDEFCSIIRLSTEFILETDNPSLV